MPNASVMVKDVSLTEALEYKEKLASLTVFPVYMAG